PALLLAAEGPSSVIAGGEPGPGNHFRNHRRVPWCHDMSAGDASDLLQLVEQLDADAHAFGAWVAGLLEPRDDTVGDDRAEQMRAHPARRAGRGKRRDADEDGETGDDALGGEARHVAAQDAEIHAELRWQEL